jgi:DMSO/TMAO reductase YedYZ molybdopterin-dependent catalytic subunit
MSPRAKILGPRGRARRPPLRDLPAPPGPFQRSFWRSPLRGPWLTSVLGAVLLFALPLIAITGLLSNDAYNPRLGDNSVGRHLGPLDFYLFPWPTHPAWLYALNQGLHVTLGLAAFPIVLAKLWSVIPRLFEWPPLRSPAHALERLSLAFLVGGALFEFVTGILNIQNYYPFQFFFTDAHYYGAWVFIAALAFHVAIKFGTLWRNVATRRALLPLRQDLAHTRPEAADSDLVATSPREPTMSRRALLGTVGAGSLLLLVQGAGQSIGGPLRRLAFLAPRGGAIGSGPNDFEINRSAVAAQIDASMTGHDWRLALSGVGGRSLQLSREQLLSMEQVSHSLPIACVEGWSTTQHWTGVRLRDLAALTGLRGKLTMDAQSLEQNGTFNTASLGSEQLADERSLLALRVNGVDLSPDHGYPARVIGPALPGVHCTKWIRSLTFRPAENR